MWNKRFAAEEYVYGTKPNEWFAQCLKKTEIGKIFLPAEGEGRNAVFAAKLGRDVFAMDYSTEGKAKARKLAEEQNVSIKYQIGDVLKNEWPEQFDAIASFFLHLPPAQRKDLHQKMLDHLRPGGLIIMEVFDVDNLPIRKMGPQNPDLLYTEKELLHDFSALEILYCEKAKRHLNEGAFHDGEGITIRFLGRKKVKA